MLVPTHADSDSSLNTDSKYDPGPWGVQEAAGTRQSGLKYAIECLEPCTCLYMFIIIEK